MKYIDYLKKYDNFDRYVFFLISLGEFGASDIARLCGISRQQVYIVQKRYENLSHKYVDSVKGVLNERISDT